MKITLHSMTASAMQTNPDRTPVKRWAKLRLWVGYVYILCAVIFAKPQFIWIVFGLVLLILGSFIRLIASATLVKDTRLITEGIYAMTRNPLYLGSALAGLGFSAMASSVCLLAAFLLLLFPIYMHMISLEEKFLLELFPESYPEYRKNVPRFLPRLWPPVKFTGTLDKIRLLKSRELMTSVLFIALSVILLTWHRSWLPG